MRCNLSCYIVSLQQHLPLAVLKLEFRANNSIEVFVATALTACGIETVMPLSDGTLASGFVATALTACGIETH